MSYGYDPDQDDSNLTRGCVTGCEPGHAAASGLPQWMREACATWDKARGLLADELNALGIQRSPAWMHEDDRAYVEEHASSYAAMLIAEDEEDEALYDLAHERVAMAFDAAGLTHKLSDERFFVALSAAAGALVHAALEARS